MTHSLTTTHALIVEQRTNLASNDGQREGEGLAAFIKLVEMISWETTATVENSDI